MKPILFIISELIPTIDMLKLDSIVNFSVLCMFFNIFILSTIITGGVCSQLLTNREHRTHAASMGNAQVTCYVCNSMESPDKCIEIRENRTDITTKCATDKMCMVKRISLTTSTGNSTSGPRLWLLERNCSKHCEPGCIMIGERTKLHACTTCCLENYCNNGSGTASILFQNSESVQHLCFYSSLLTIFFSIF